MADWFEGVGGVAAHDALLAAASGKNNSREKDRRRFAPHAERVYACLRARRIDPQASLPVIGLREMGWMRGFFQPRLFQNGQNSNFLAWLREIFPQSIRAGPSERETVFLL
jgi:hypothetical protein